MCILREWHACKSIMHAPHTHVIADRRYALSSMHSLMVRKGKSCQIWWLMLPDTLKTHPSRTTWQKQPRQHLSRLERLTWHIVLLISYTHWGYHTRHWTTLVHNWGLDKLVTLCLWRLLPQILDRHPRHGTNSLSTGQPFLPTSRLRAWGAYVLPRTPDNTHPYLRAQ